MWSAWHQAAWDGVDLKEACAKETIDAPHPLFLGLTRWGKSSTHRRLISRLMNHTQDWTTIRWGDVAWGGSLTLIDLAVDRNLPYLFKRCKKNGVIPNERTWKMALLQDTNEAMVLLGMYFTPPENLPHQHPHVQAMEAARQRALLEQQTQEAHGEGSSRRL
jgi:hypothetical protein